MTNTAYVPGVCNIGPAEIRRRRISGIGGAVVAGCVLAATMRCGAPKPLRLVAVLPAAAAKRILAQSLAIGAGVGGASLLLP